MPRGLRVFTLAEHRSALTTLAVHEPLGLLATGTADGTVRVFFHRSEAAATPTDGATPACDAAPLCRWTLHGHVTHVTALAFAARAAHAAHATATAVTAADVIAGDTGVAAPGGPVRRRHAPLGKEASVVAAASAVGVLRLLTASQDGQIRVWDVGEGARGACLATLSYHTQAVHALAYDAACNVLVSAGLDERVVLWSGTDYRRLYRKHTPGATALALRDSVLVVGHATTAPAPAALAAPRPGSSSWDRHAYAPAWADRRVGLALLDVRTQTVLRRALPLRPVNRPDDGTMHRLAFAGDALVVGAGDHVTVLRLSRTRAIKRD
jgi:WD40 repeat protein